VAHNYKELKIWQRSVDLVDLCYDYVADLPQDERFNLKSQIIRCVCSVPANIAEGCGKRTKKHFAEYISISLGSCFELETHIIICDRRKFGKEEIRNKILKELSELKNMIFSFRETLESTIIKS
jgi:four helix bundle protein